MPTKKEKKTKTGNRKQEKVRFKVRKVVSSIIPLPLNLKSG